MQGKLQKVQVMIFQSAKQIPETVITTELIKLPEHDLPGQIKHVKHWNDSENIRYPDPGQGIDQRKLPLDEAGKNEPRDQDQNHLNSKEGSHGPKDANHHAARRVLRRIRSAHDRDLQPVSQPAFQAFVPGSFVTLFQNSQPPTGLCLQPSIQSYLVIAQEYC